MRLSNTLARRKDELPPPPGPIRMYFCGPTVYQRIHVGNARPFVVSMWLKRWLEGRGYRVTLVENITDINDKIYRAAPGRSAELAEQASNWYVEDTDRLGLGRPDREPKASETVPEITSLIEELIGEDLAYPAGGDVYYRVARFGEYGQLSRRVGPRNAPSLFHDGALAQADGFRRRGVGTSTRPGRGISQRLPGPERERRCPDGLRASTRGRFQYARSACSASPMA